MTRALAFIIFNILMAKGFVADEIWCYNCSTNSLLPDDGCEGPNFNPDYITRCPPNKMYCKVQRTTATIAGIRSTQTIRECTDVYLDRCIFNELLRVETCFGTCKTNVCNGATRKTVAIISFTTLVSLILLSIIWR